MDANMSDLIGGVLSNPDMMNKIKVMMPLITQMMKSDEPPPVQAPAVIQAGQSANQPGTAADFMISENVAAALQNLIAALNQSQPDQSAETAIPVLARAEQPPEPQPGTILSNISDISGVPADKQPEAVNAVNIEKTLNTLKEVTSVASPENDHRAKLLLSLKPFLSESRRIKIDTAIKYINAAKILTSFGKNGFAKF